MVINFKDERNNYKYLIIVISSILFCCSCTSYITHNDYIWNYNLKTDNIDANLYKVSNDSLFVFICAYYNKEYYKIILDLKNGKRLNLKAFELKSSKDYETNNHLANNDSIIDNIKYKSIYLKTPDYFKYFLVYTIKRPAISGRGLASLFKATDIIHIIKKSTKKEYVFEFYSQIYDLNYYKDKYLIISYTDDWKKQVSVAMIDLDKLIGEE